MTEEKDKEKDREQGFPAQQLSYSKKGEKWRRQCVDWACNRTYYNYEPVRKSVSHKKINRDLVEGILHPEDMRRVVAPDMRNVAFKPDEIQHYPIINPKINLLVGEERKRVFEHKVVVTNPNGVSEVERDKRDEVRRRYEEFLGGEQQDEQQDVAQMARVNEFMTYEWQDMREIRANALLDHYDKEQSFDMKFNDGFRDAITYGEEMYICDIVGGEPVLTKLDPLSVHAFRSGNSEKLEDADVIVIESYWSVGKVIDWFHDALTESDLKKLDCVNRKGGDNDDEVEAAYFEQLYNPAFVGEEGVMIPDGEGFPEAVMQDAGLSPYDTVGNVRVIRVFWRSRKKIMRVKSYDPITGETVYDIYPEGHIIDESMGEEAEDLWVNEAWEGTKIGADIYVNIRPRPVQYNSMGNPSRCHFGIVGTIYGSNGRKPFSLVDMMKPYNYLYDVIHDRLNKLISRSWGAILKLDLAQVPSGWDIEKWLYYAKESGVAITDSFKEGNVGAATGKLAGGLNNNSSGVINLNDAAAISQNIQLLQFLQGEMASVVGISAQREGAIENRETVGGVERATVQSSHITEWLFSVHNDTKKRVYECFLETAKAAMRGRNKKFQHLLGDGSVMLVNIDGDEFAECDYGLVVDYGSDAQRLQQGLETLAQAALQNQTLDFSTIMKLYNTGSLAEKQRLVEKAEREMRQNQQQAQQAAAEQQQSATKLQLQLEQNKMDAEMKLKELDAQTRIKVAEIESQGRIEAAAAQSMYRNDDSDSEERRRQFDERMALERRRLDVQERKYNSDRDDKRRKADSDNRNKELDRTQRDIQSLRSEETKRYINDRKIQNGTNTSVSKDKE